VKTIRVLYFAAVRELVTKSEEELELLPGVTRVSDLLAHLESVHPELRGQLTGVRVAVNEEFADAMDPVRPNDVVALIPPVAGG
jgi:molybdopterin synthase sulfur carrier subunit